MTVFHYTDAPIGKVLAYQYTCIQYQKHILYNTFFVQYMQYQMMASKASSIPGFSTPQWQANKRQRSRVNTTDNSRAHKFKVSVMKLHET